jgi:beta-phosphoglucomutase
MHKSGRCAAVIFDLDGVLVTTDEHHYRAWKRMADEEGIPFDRDTNDRLRGVSRMESLSIILERAPRPYAEPERAALAERKNAYYRGFLAGLSAADILPGALETIDALKAKGVRVAVASSSRNAQAILEKTGLAGRFDAIADGTEISRSKPDPEVFLVAAQKLGVEPARCVVVEDAEAGLEAARAAGMRSFAVGAAARSERAASRAPDLSRADIDELIDPKP